MPNSQLLHFFRMKLQMLRNELKIRLRKDWRGMGVQIPSTRPLENSNKRMKKRLKTVHRAYGGHLAHSVVKERIVRAFLIEEQKIVKKVEAPVL